MALLWHPKLQPHLASEAAFWVYDNEKPIIYHTVLVGKTSFPMEFWKRVQVPKKEHASEWQCADFPGSLVLFYFCRACGFKFLVCKKSEIWECHNKARYVSEELSFFIFMNLWAPWQNQ